MKQDDLINVFKQPQGWQDWRPATQLLAADAYAASLTDGQMKYHW